MLQIVQAYDRSPIVEVATDDAGGASRRARPGEECVELLVLLPAGQWAALEQAASRRGVTVGRLLRRLVRDFLGAEADGGSPASAER